MTEVKNIYLDTLMIKIKYRRRINKKKKKKKEINRFTTEVKLKGKEFSFFFSYFFICESSKFPFDRNKKRFHVIAIFNFICCTSVRLYY